MLSVHSLNSLSAICLCLQCIHLCICILNLVPEKQINTLGIFGHLGKCICMSDITYPTIFLIVIPIICLPSDLNDPGGWSEMVVVCSKYICVCKNWTYDQNKRNSFHLVEKDWLLSFALCLKQLLKKTQTGNTSDCCATNGCLVMYLYKWNHRPTTFVRHDG